MSLVVLFHACLCAWSWSYQLPTSCTVFYFPPDLCSTDVDLTRKTQAESEDEEAKSKQDLEASTD